MQLIAFILACYGMANILTISAILKKPRDLFASLGNFPKKLIHCMMCVGFWVGFFLSLCGLGPYSCYNGEHPIAATLADACIGSASAWIIYLLTYSKMFDAESTPR